MEVRPADPEARHAALVTIAITLAISAALAAFMTLYPEQTNQLLNGIFRYIIASPTLILLSSLLLIAPVLVTGIYLFVTGKNIAAIRQFPLPGQKTIRRTRLLTGATAVRHGRILQILAALILLAGLVLPLLLYRLSSILLT